MVLILILLMFNLSFSSTVYASADITENDPVITAPAEEKIPVETVKKKGGNTLLWVILAAVVIGGGAAAVAGGGSDSGSSSSSSPTPSSDTGDVTVSW